MTMTWVYVALVAVAVLSLVRIASSLRGATRKEENDWDARFITQLRKAGVDPFEAHPVDFFFALPSEAGSRAIATELEADGFEVDTRPETEGSGWSLHAQREMRLVIPDMQALTKRFHALADAQGGKYDGWAVAKARGIARRKI